MLMVTINKKLQALTQDKIGPITDEYLKGWQDLLPKYGFTIKGFNNKRKSFGLDPLTREMSVKYRIEYVKTHFGVDEIKKTLFAYLQTARLDKARWAGIDLFDCHFNGKDYAKCFKGIVGAAQFRGLSERARVEKIKETDAKLYGGIGLSGKSTLANAQKTNQERYGGNNVMSGKIIREVDRFDKTGHSTLLDFLNVPERHSWLTKIKTAVNDFKTTGKKSSWLQLQSRHEILAFVLLIEKFGYEDVIPQYGLDTPDARYPYNCDFYVKSRDLFIEMNVHYTHVGHWYDSTSTKDRQQLVKFEKSTTSYSKNIIRAWTYADLEKRNIARSNNLNYLVFWNGRSDQNNVPTLVDFKIWLNDYDTDTKRFLKDYPENTY